MRYPFFLDDYLNLDVRATEVPAKSYLALHEENVRYRTQAYASVMAPLLAVETSRMYFASSPLV